MVAVAAPQRHPVVAQLMDELAAAQRYNIGFPGATDLRFPELADLWTGLLLNNIGGPWDVDGHGSNHTKTYEQEVVNLVADLFRAPTKRWGYVTTGSTEATHHALDEAWQTYPDLVVYASEAAHYSVANGTRLQKLPLVKIRTDPAGRMDISDLLSKLSARRCRAAMVVATAGTPMTEAVDDVAAIAQACDDVKITRRRIHVDAALAGIPLALLPGHRRPAFDFTAGATSMGCSGHKFLGTLDPCGIVVYGHTPAQASGTRISYTGTHNSTLTGSRSGHTPMKLWWSLTSQGWEGHHRRAESARHLAAYVREKLAMIGWFMIDGDLFGSRSWKWNPEAVTVPLAKPPRALLKKWPLPYDGGGARIVCVPGLQTDQIDEFIDDLALAVKGSI